MGRVMGCEVDYAYELTCTRCGYTGKDIHLSRDWMRRSTRFENFDIRSQGGRAPGVPTQDYFEVAGCPKCGSAADTAYRRVKRDGSEEKWE